jgi:uncharacterized cysteine cluster protein YcgN (CxxCxxCC family)
MNRENVCLRCGRCCYFADIRPGGVLIRSNDACPSLDKKTNLCKIYSVRRQMNPKCTLLEMAIANRVLPTDCPYVKNIPGYEGPVE